MYGVCGSAVGIWLCIGGVVHSDALNNWAIGASSVGDVLFAKGMAAPSTRTLDAKVYWPGNHMSLKPISTYMMLCGGRITTSVTPSMLAVRAGAGRCEYSRSGPAMGVTFFTPPSTHVSYDQWMSVFAAGPKVTET